MLAIGNLKDRFSFQICVIRRKFIDFTDTNYIVRQISLSSIKTLTRMIRPLTLPIDRTSIESLYCKSLYWISKRCCWMILFKVHNYLLALLERQITESKAC